MIRRWRERRRRERVTSAVLSAAFLWIRAHAGRRPGQTAEPAARLAEIRRVADLCVTAMSLPTAESLGRLWEDGNDDLRRLIRHNLEAKGLDPAVIPATTTVLAAPR